MARGRSTFMHPSKRLLGVKQRILQLIQRRQNAFQHVKLWRIMSSVPPSPAYSVMPRSCLGQGDTHNAESANGMARPCSCPASVLSWQGGANDKEHAMSQKLNAAIAVIGIDIGKNSFHIVGHDNP